MADEPDELGEALTAEEILTFGPVVEAQVWHPMWVLQERAPIAVAAGRPKFGPVFNEDGVGKAVVIRPCVSRGRRVRGLPPIYSPSMLEAHAGVFSGWPMFMDHVPGELAKVVAKRGRSVKDIGGQVLSSHWNGTFVHEEDGNYGYRPGGVLAEVYANPIVQRIVGKNPNVLHTSIHAWPTSGKPGAAPWNSKVKGMLIEGIRRQPQGSLDFVPRGGAGGRLLLEGDEGGWPNPSWDDEDLRLVVSVAESFYSADAVAGEKTPNTLPTDPAELRAWVQEHAPHLLPALTEAAAGNGNGSGVTATGATLTKDDVSAMIREAVDGGTSKIEVAEEQLTERFEERLAEREEQRSFADEAKALIEAAEGIPDLWKRDLIARYSMRPDGAPKALLVESTTDDDGATLSKRDVLRANVERDLTHTRELIAEARGKPRVKGEGGAARDAGGDDPKRRESEKVEEQTGEWADSLVDLGIFESADAAYGALGEEKPSGKDDD